MRSGHFYSFIAINDSVTTQKVTADTLKKALQTSKDTISAVKIKADTSTAMLPVRLKKTAADTAKVIKTITPSVAKAEIKEIHVLNDTVRLIKKHKTPHKSFDRFTFYSQQDSTFSYNSGVFTEIDHSSTSLISGINIIPHQYQQIYLNWTLLIALSSVLLLMGLKAYYQKFVTQVVSTMVNFQLAEKMLREKNILVRRAFFMLNLNYFFVFSLFVLLITRMTGIKLSGDYLKDYIYISLIVLAVLIIRLIIITLLGLIFEVRSTTNEYVHNIYLINKNIGLVLLPLVFAAIYTNDSISRIILITGLIIVILASVYKIIRGLQIILKNGVLLFYSFLYLCTLELLPVVLGSKLLIALS